MNKTTRIVEELARQSESSDRPDARRMRDVLPQIEESIARGVARKKIFQILQGEGFTFTFESFLVTLARLRKEKKKGKKPAASAQRGAPAPPQSTSSNPLKKLESEAKVSEFNPIPQVEFEVAQQTQKEKT